MSDMPVFEWIVDWYESQKVVHITGSPSKRGKEIFGSLTLLLLLTVSPMTECADGL